MMYYNISKIISHIFNLIKLSKSYQNLMNIAVLLLPVLFGQCAVHGSSVGVWRSISVYCDWHWWLSWSPLMSTHADNLCDVYTLNYDHTQILVAITADFHSLKGTYHAKCTGALLLVCPEMCCELESRSAFSKPKNHNWTHFEQFGTHTPLISKTISTQSQNAYNLQ